MLELRRLLIATLIAGLAFAGCQRGADDATEAEEGTINDTIVIEGEGDLEEAVEETGEAIGEGAEAVGEGVEEGAKAVGEAAEEVGERAKDTAEEVN